MGFRPLDCDVFFFHSFLRLLLKRLCLEVDCFRVLFPFSPVSCSASLSRGLSFALFLRGGCLEDVKRRAPESQRVLLFCELIRRVSANLDREPRANNIMKTMGLTSEAIIQRKLTDSLDIVKLRFRIT